MERERKKIFPLHIKLKAKIPDPNVKFTVVYVCVSACVCVQERDVLLEWIFPLARDH